MQQIINKDDDVLDILITDFTDSMFCTAFKTYFSELGIEVNDWDGVFSEMNDEGDNEAFIRMTESGEVIGFIQCKPISFTSYFFEETILFIREFWVSEKYRNLGHGKELLNLAETHFKKKGIFTSILTTDTAEAFYIKNGYRRAPACKAKNQDDVFIKRFA